MTFKYAETSLLAVPGRMCMEELAFLGTLASRVPPGGKIVEIGCFYGRSTNAMARANPNAQIVSIDTFEDVEWTQRYAKRFRNVPPFGLSAFEQYTRDFENVTAIQGYSPDVVSDWAEPIDMYFEDAVHGNPTLKRNLDFWFDKLKPGGIACGHDYSRRFSDIKREVDGWAKHWNTHVRVVGSLWALRKPIPGEPAEITQAGFAPSLTIFPNLVIHGSCRKSGPFRAIDGYWAGAHLDKDRMSWFQISALGKTACPPIEYRIGGPTVGDGPWHPLGEKARLLKDGKVQPFTRLAIRVRPSAAQDAPKVIYRVAARGRHFESGQSEWATDGAWAHLANEAAPVNALTVQFASAVPEPESSGLQQHPAEKLRRAGHSLSQTLIKRSRKLLNRR